MIQLNHGFTRKWILNGTVIGKATSDGVIDANGTSDTTKYHSRIPKMVVISR